MSAKQQTARLATYIMSNIPNEPSENEGAGDCAIRLLEYYRQALGQIAKRLHHDLRSPADIEEAYETAVLALEGEFVM